MVDGLALARDAQPRSRSMTRTRPVSSRAPARGRRRAWTAGVPGAPFRARPHAARIVLDRPTPRAVRRLGSGDVRQPDGGAHFTLTFSSHRGARRSIPRARRTVYAGGTGGPKWERRYSEERGRGAGLAHRRRLPFGESSGRLADRRPVKRRTTCSRASATGDFVYSYYSVQAGHDLIGSRDGGLSWRILPRRRPVPAKTVNASPSIPARARPSTRPWPRSIARRTAAPTGRRARSPRARSSARSRSTP